MKPFLLGLILLLTAPAVQAQRLVIGEKAPAVQPGEWLAGQPGELTGKPVLVDFFHSSNDQCVANLTRLNALQQSHAGSLAVVLVCREPADKIRPLIEGKGYRFSTVLDDNGKTFTAYQVRFVPFAALIDARGRLVWTGNIANLPDETVARAVR